MRQRKYRLTAHLHSRGFSLFEMVVVICSIVILYMVAAQRLSELPAAAERASFFGTLAQVKTGVQIEMINRLTAGEYQELLALEGSNPMDFFVEVPGNYRGVLEVVTDRNVTRGSWYFESSTGQLVYVVGGRSIQDVEVLIGGVRVNLGQIRMRLENVYDSDPQASDNGSIEEFDNWQGLLLKDVYEYRWSRVNEIPTDFNANS